ncbi:MAG: beta-propeller fold lactonase family protein [Planctomycetota bacterium]
MIDRLPTISLASHPARSSTFRQQLQRVLCAGVALLIVSACGGGGGGSGGGSQMTLEEVSNGFGRLLPHTTHELDSNGQPNPQSLIELRTVAQIFQHVRLNNPVLPVTQWPTTAQLPDGSPGNQFVYARFRRTLDVDSVFDPAASAAVNENLRGSITVLAVDPVTGQTTAVEGRGFIGGKTYGRPNPDSPGELLLETWVERIGGDPTVVAVDGYVDPPGHGFPGTQGAVPFSGAEALIDPRTFVFIPDSDDDLSTHETFPAGRQIRIRLTSGVLSESGQPLPEEALASTTVGDDTIPPEVAISGAAQSPTIIPGNGDTDVDPQTNILIEFTEPVQPRTVGPFDDGSSPVISSAVTLEFGPQTSLVTVPHSITPVSPFDLSRYRLRPAYGFPGEANNVVGALTCGEFSEVRVRTAIEQVQDLVGTFNTLAPATSFFTGSGPGLVNAPVAPEAIYVGRAGSEPGISVIDLNGFGAGTGNPTFDPANPVTQGNSNFPNNPNLVLQGSLICPPIAPGTCTFNGGSAGVFTLTKDSSLSDKLAKAPVIASVADMGLGHALDTTFNASLPFGCQSGGGNICANTGLKFLQLATGSNGGAQPSGANLFPVKIIFGGENLATWAPHPNPPPLVFPPLCLAPLIGAQEPTAIDTIIPVIQGGKGLTNLLNPAGDPFGNPNSFPQQPPSGLLGDNPRTFMQGPSLPAQNIAACFQYGERQQIGQFLYVCDRIAQEVVVLNSNRFSVIERIPMPDPTRFAISPNLDFIAVSSEGSNSVRFIDIDPGSATFHQIVRTVPVGVSPVGIAWESGGESIFVANRGDSSMSIISGFTFALRKTVLANLSQPFEVVTTPRQFGFGFNRGVHFAYLMNSNGRVSVYESGPSGINGWGFDDIIGTPTFIFDNPKAMTVDVQDLRSAVWIAHENQLGLDGAPTGLGGGALSNMALTSATNGQIPLDPGAFVDPQLRDMAWTIRSSIGSTRLSGIPVDIAFDNLTNGSFLDNFTSQFSPSGSVPLNGKAVVKVANGGGAMANQPLYMFAAVPTPGVVDVFNVRTGGTLVDTNVFEPGFQSIPATGANIVMDYFRQ